MDYNRIVAVTGMPGLYEVLSSKTDGAIVRSLEDQSTKFISSRIHNLSHLESIEVYTVRDNVTLADVFSSMKENKTAIPDVKDSNAIRTYFEKVYPDLDFERVYASDMKKMVKWFEVLQQNQVDFTAKPEEAEAIAEEVAVLEPAVEEPKPAKTKSKAPAAAKPVAEKSAAAKSGGTKSGATKTAAAKKAKAKTAEAEKPKKTAKKK
jgi:hypothetical protein